MRNKLNVNTPVYKIHFDGHKEKIKEQTQNYYQEHKKEIPEITIYKKSDYRNKYGTQEIEVCSTGKNSCDYTHTETMVAYVRDIEVIGDKQFKFIFFTLYLDAKIYYYPAFISLFHIDMVLLLRLFL